ncbi:inosine monophosphate dehydrogenase [Parathielavia appendiculata]|uniref:Inosine monophosphate dehydrogenase n=1 Tax=Parathielavia appendiculata TaxID=2587402 RepID=A0AAN6U7Z2_9PEZI|nr:inosine monophosphate dehydrogenase [Parathielavia appendiculata]
MVHQTRSKLTALFPHAQHPVIISAPMLGTANSTLAAEVSKAGGLGIIPAGFDFTPSSTHLTTLDSELSAARTKLNILPTVSKYDDPLPVGAGFILSHPSFLTHFLTTALPLLRANRPAAVWLFAPRADDVASGAVRTAIAALKAEGFVVMFQVGTVAAARQAARDGVDVLVCQGVDAGGHQFAGGAGVVSLVPEVVDMLAQEREELGLGEREVVVVAAGGIVDGRGVAAALALGKFSCVCVVQFTVAEEAWTPEFRRNLILETRDGGPATVKTPVLDDIQGTPIWSGIYDGRALAGKSWQDHAAGMPLEENRRLFKEADKAGDTSRKITWVGTGVGLVKRIQPAADIVREVRGDALRRIRGLQSAS